MQVTAFSCHLIGALLPHAPPLDPEHRPQVARDIATTLSALIALSPFHVRLGIGILFAALRIWLGVTMFGGLSPKTSPARVERQMARFSRLGAPALALVRLLNSLTALAYMEHPLVAPQLIATDFHTWQDRQRALRQQELLGAQR